MNNIDYISTPNVECPNPKCKILHNVFISSEATGEEKTFPYYRVNSFATECSCGCKISFNKTFFAHVPFEDYQITYDLGNTKPIVEQPVIIDTREGWSDTTVSEHTILKPVYEHTILKPGEVHPVDIESSFSFDTSDNSSY